MIGLFPTHFVSTNALVISLLFFVGGTLVLLRSLLTQDRFISAQALTVANLELQLQSSAAERQCVNERLDALQEQCIQLRARQQLVEKHGSDTQRIDLAMRMLRRGNSDAQALQDLGLSASEIKLLLTLHSTPQAHSERVPTPDTATPRSQTETERPCLAEKARVSHSQSSQGARLAKLFAEAAV